jgi:hypothetical protein
MDLGKFGILKNLQPESVKLLSYFNPPLSNLRSAMTAEKWAPGWATAQGALLIISLPFVDFRVLSR